MGSREAMKPRGETDGSTRIRMFLLFMFSGVVSGDLLLSSTVRAGGDVTLSCTDVIKGQRNCSSTTWIYSKSGSTVELFNLGKVKNSRSDRLSLAENCSLVLKNVSAEEAGSYTCRQYERVGAPQSGSDALVRLSVVTLTEEPDQNKVTFTCSVSPYDGNEQDVKWLFNGNYVDEDHLEIKTSSPSSCSAAVTFHTSSYFYSSRYKTFTCEVATGNKKQLFSFSSRPTGDETTTFTSPTTDSGGNSHDPKSGLTWVYVGVGVVTVALIIALTIVILRRNQASQQKSPKPSSVGTTSDPGAAPSAPEGEQVEAEGGVAYASISYTKNPNRGSRGVKKDDDDVTYSMVQAPPTDPSSLYASVAKKPKQSK